MRQKIFWQKSYSNNNFFTKSWLTVNFIKMSLSLVIQQHIFILVISSESKVGICMLSLILYPNNTFYSFHANTFHTTYVDIWNKCYNLNMLRKCQIQHVLKIPLRLKRSGFMYHIIFIVSQWTMNMRIYSCITSHIQRLKHPHTHSDEFVNIIKQHINIGLYPATSKISDC